MTDRYAIIKSTGVFLTHDPGFALGGGLKRPILCGLQDFHDFAQAAPHLFADVLLRVHAVCAALGREGALPEGDRSVARGVRAAEGRRAWRHGDQCCDGAGEEAKAKPRDLADRIADKLRADPLIEKVDIAGPGFINLTLQPSAWFGALRSVLEQGNGYGRSAIGAAEKVNVEYVSANPTGPMHVGHCRGAVFGDALASLLSFAGYDVTQGILHQRCWRAGGRARTLRVSALSRGAQQREPSVRFRKDFIG